MISCAWRRAASSVGGKLSASDGRNGERLELELIGRIYELSSGDGEWSDLLELWEAYYLPFLQAGTAAPGGGEANEAQQRLAQHFETAVEILRNRRKPDDGPDRSDFDAFPFGALLFDAEGKVIAANSAAHSILSVEGIGEAVHTAGRTPSSRGSGSNSGASDVELMLLRGVDGLTQVPIVRFAVGARLDAFGDERPPVDSRFARTVRSFPETAEIAILLTSRLSEASIERLQSAFNLTHAESHLLARLVEGRNLEWVAEASGRSIETLRTQLKSIYAKTGTNRQPTVVSLAIAVARAHEIGNVLAPAFASGSGVTAPPDAWLKETQGTIRTTVVPLNAARRLQVHEQGRKDGIPCLLFHAPILPPYFPMRWNEAIEMSGLRLIMPLRPGYASSTPEKYGPDAPHRFAHDLARLLDGLHIGRVHVITMGLGACWAGPFCVLHESRVKSVQVATLPLGADRAEAAGIWHDMPFFRRVNLFQPRLLQPLIRFSIRLFLQAPQHRQMAMVKRIYPNPESDRGFFDRPENADWMSSWANWIAPTSEAGLTTDLLVQDGIDWASEFARIKAPTRLYQGEANPSNDWRKIEAYAAEMASATVDLYPGAGELFIYDAVQDLIANILIAEGR